MTTYDRRSFLAITGSAVAGLAAGSTARATATKKGCGLVVGHREGAEVGIEIFAQGGNAVDAIVAAALVAGVIAVPKCGVGGYGGHLTVGMPNGKLGCIDFNSVAPAAARADMFPVD
ncbi:MAG TPA: gamma-glutamyltransferase, partial [Lacipirellulaceae bacterium]|nr:gamma-glutamyltransferase [Lacipirellulaceae bacterium]